MITTEGISHWRLGTNQNLLHFSLVLRSRLENKRVEDNKLVCPVVGKFLFIPIAPIEFFFLRGNVQKQQTVVVVYFRGFYSTTFSIKKPVCRQPTS